MKSEILDREEAMSEGVIAISRAEHALQMLKDKYEWDYEPTVAGAYKAANTVHADRYCAENDLRSWDYVVGYSDIMFLVNVAIDYCFNAKTIIENNLEGGQTA